MPDNKFGTQRILKNIDRLVRGDLPVLLANQAENFFVDSFKKSGWDDGGVQRWAPRKDKGPKSKGRKLLVKSGALRRAVGNSIRSARFEKVQLVVALPYAAVHNDGYNGPRKAHTKAVFTRSRTSEFIGLRRGNDGKLKMKRKYTTVFIRSGERNVGDHNMNMPRRRFMGDSKTLRGMQRKIIIKQIDKVWRA